jgi:hypothetical protein
MVESLETNHGASPAQARQNLKYEGFPNPGLDFRFEKFGEVTRGMNTRIAERL